jgi:alkyl hydroperoxide reductase subunit D
MNFEQLKSAIPEYAKDLRLNLSALANESALSATQRAGAFIASAYAAGNADVIRAVHAEFAAHLSETQLQAAKTAAAIMAMNNVYYRFVHLAKNPEYGEMPAKLRMNALANHGAEKIDFELWSLAVSAINGCGMCIDAHEVVVREHGANAQAVQAAVRIASVIAAVCAVLRAQAAQNDLPLVELKVA